MSLFSFCEGSQYSRGCAHGRAAADADDARPLGASATHSRKIAIPRLAQQGRLGAPECSSCSPAGRFGVVHGGPETRHSLGHGCETRARSERPPGEVPRGPMENEGPMKQGRRHWASWLHS